MLMVDAVDGDADLALFALAWLKNNRNATKAYQELHPGATAKSAAVLGSRMLGRINIPLILSAMGLGVPEYVEKIKKGMDATETVMVPAGKYKNGMPKYVKVKKPLHEVQDSYHSKLGNLLGLEGKSAMVQVQANFNQVITDKKNDYGI